jgi:lipid-A-disaccharide synthase-like uncharacterized protein
MSLKLNSRRSWLVVLCISSLWTALTVCPVLYFSLFPKLEFREIVHKLQVSNSSDLGSDTAVSERISMYGRLREAIQITSYVGVTFTLQHGKNQSMRRSQAAYIAWFEKLQGPTLLVIQEIQTDDSVKTFQVGEGELVTIVRGFALPLFALIASLYMVRRRKFAPLGPNLKEP